MPKISLIIPTFNNEKYLKQAIDSAVNQTLKDIEIIIINDGSTDGSIDIINEYKKKDKRIIVVNQLNQGQSVSRNNGIRISQSEYICFMDSDDDAKLTMLEELYEFAIKNKSDLVCTKYQRIHQGGGFFIVDRGIPSNKRFSSELSNPKLPASIWGQLYKKSLFIDNNITFPEGIFYEDQLTSIQLFYYAKKVTFLDNHYYNYYVRTNSTTTKVDKKRIDDIFTVIVLIKDFFNDKDILSLHKINLLAKHMKLVSNYIIAPLEKNMNVDKTIYLFEKIKSSVFFNKNDIEKVREEYFGIYFSFISQMIMLEQNAKVSFDNQLFCPTTLKYLRSEIHSNGSISFERLVISKLLKLEIKDVIVYGGGKIFNDIKPLLEQQGINIIGVIDKNVSILESISLDDFFQDGFICPIIISSIAYSSEIENIILSHEKYDRKYKIISAKTLLEI